MAITTIYSTSLGFVRGTWTHTQGAAEETITVKGHIFGAHLWHIDSSGLYDANVKFSISTSGSTSTLKIHAQAEVTTGRYIVFVA